MTDVLRDLASAMVSDSAKQLGKIIREATLRHGFSKTDVLENGHIVETEKARRFYVGDVLIAEIKSPEFSIRTANNFSKLVCMSQKFRVE